MHICKPIQEDVSLWRQSYQRNLFRTDNWPWNNAKVYKNTVFSNNNKTEQILILAVWPPEACDFK